jgi:hypothetical protein
MAPGEDLLSGVRAYEVFGYQKAEHLIGEDTGEGRVIEDGNWLE